MQLHARRVLAQQEMRRGNFSRYIRKQRRVVYFSDSLLLNIFNAILLCYLSSLIIPCNFWLALDHTGYIDKVQCWSHPPRSPCHEPHLVSEYVYVLYVIFFTIIDEFLTFNVSSIVLTDVIAVLSVRNRGMYIMITFQILYPSPSRFFVTSLTIHRFRAGPTESSRGKGFSNRGQVCRASCKHTTHG